MKLHVEGTVDFLGCGTLCSGGDPATQFSYAQNDVPTGEGPCNGDSGGPAFVTRGAQVYVGGITSYGDTGCRIYGVSTRVDATAFEAYVRDFVAASGGSGASGTTTSSSTSTSTSTTTTGGGTGDCGDGTCGEGESCDGRDGTAACSSDCAGRVGGKPAQRYCFVEGTCVGPGCP